MKEVEAIAFSPGHLPSDVVSHLGIWLVPVVSLGLIELSLVSGNLPENNDQRAPIHNTLS
jgi:hypothetical protein